MATRIAMWSGPRNISTAMLRSWENRSDTSVCDEPFYAHWLVRTGIGHPGREEVIANCETDWRAVADRLTGPVPGAAPLFYQKHMAHHLFADMIGEWMDDLTHAFLIREPREMLLSLSKMMTAPSIEETGLPQQWRLYCRLQERGHKRPPVLDARDVLRDPETMLRRLCRRLGVSFSSRMLAWPAGSRETDGIWAKYWYASVEKSTGFQPPGHTDEPVPAGLEAVFDEATDYYLRLYDVRMTRNGG